MKDRETALKLIDDCKLALKRAEDSLEEIDRPELRHGAYGIEQHRYDNVIIIKPKLCWPDRLRPIGINSKGEWNYADEARFGLVLQFGNIYNDMANGR